MTMIEPRKEERDYIKKKDKDYSYLYHSVDEIKAYMSGYIVCNIILTGAFIFGLCIQEYMIATYNIAFTVLEYIVYPIVEAIWIFNFVNTHKDYKQAKRRKKNMNFLNL